MKHAGLRTTVAGVAVVATLGSLSACGGHSSDKASGSKGSSKAASAKPASALDALRTAASKTDQAQSAKITGTTTVVNGTSGSMTIGMNGALDWSNGMSGNIDMKMGGGLASSLAKLGMDGTMKAVYTPDAMYIDMGPAVAKSTGGKPWMKYSYDTLAKVMGASGNAMKEEFQNNNPTRSVQMLIASGDVKSLGTVTVNGEQTTHYAGTVDVAKLVASPSSGLDAATAKQLQAQLKQQGVTSDVVDLWVDGHGLLVKKSEKLKTGSGSMNSVASYSDYGVKVTVKTPPASQTTDVASLMAQQGK